MHWKPFKLQSTSNTKFKSDSFKTGKSYICAAKKQRLPNAFAFVHCVNQSVRQRTFTSSTLSSPNRMEIEKRKCQRKPNGTTAVNAMTVHTPCAMPSNQILFAHFLIFFLSACQMPLLIDVRIDDKILSVCAGRLQFAYCQRANKHQIQFIRFAHKHQTESRHRTTVKTKQMVPCSPVINDFERKIAINVIANVTPSP